MTASQKAMVAARMANLPLGANQYREKRVRTSYGPSETPLISRAEAAKTVGVGTSYVERAGAA